jgi:hypothetical protein
MRNRMGAGNPRAEDRAILGLAGTEDRPTFWGIEYSRSPNPDEEPSGLLAVPLPWDEREGYVIRSAVLVYESNALAQASLDHYLTLSGAAAYSYGLLPFAPGELAEVLEARPEGGGFERVALNPVPSRYFPEAVAYSAGWATDEFVAELRGL